MLRRAYLLSLILTLAARPALAQPEPARVMELKRLKVEAESRGSQIKAKYAPSAQQYINARAKYGVARAHYEGLLAFMKQAILNGDPAAIQASDSLEAAAKDARASVQTYFEYVDRSLGLAQSKSAAAVIAVIASGVAVVLDIVKGVDSGSKIMVERETARKSLAETLERDLSWKSWEDLPK